jgi:hypothetical protein
MSNEESRIAHRTTIRGSSVTKLHTYFYVFFFWCGIVATGDSDHGQPKSRSCSIGMLRGEKNYQACEVDEIQVMLTGRTNIMWGQHYCVKK